MQRRLLNYGDGFTQEFFKLYNLQHLPVGVFSGLEFSVVRPDTFKLTAGSVMMPNGIIIVESTDVEFNPVVPLPGLATVYTLKIRHEDVQLLGGGQAATYELVNTLSPALANEVVLGYILHPGSGAAFAASMWRPTTRFRSDIYAATQIAQQPQDRHAPHSGLVTLGSHITRSQNLSSSVLYDRFNADGTTPGGGDTVVVTIPFTMGRARPRRIFVNHILAVTDTIEIFICDTNGNLLSLITVPGLAAPTLTHIAVPVSATFNENEAYYVRVRLTLHALNNGDLSSIRVAFDPLA